jgi:outer membrane lipoprotein-sorting protein
MIKYSISISIFICSIFMLNAQNNTDAKQLMDGWVQTVQSRGMRASFIIKSSQENNVTSQEVSGDIVMKGNRLYIDTEEFSLWFNGLTQWVYFKEAGEVNITTPTKEELAQTNPMTIILDYASKFTLKMINHADAHHYVVEMTPKNKPEHFDKLIVRFYKKDKMLQSIKLQDKTPATHEIIFTNFQQNASISTEMFNFDASQYEGVILNDLR